MQINCSYNINKYIEFISTCMSMYGLKVYIPVRAWTWLPRRISPSLVTPTVYYNKSTIVICYKFYLEHKAQSGLMNKGEK